MIKKSLSEYLNFTYYLMEIFDTKIQINDWKMDGNNLIGYLDIDDEKFRIIFEPLSLSPFNGVNIAFEKLINSTWSQDLSISAKNASKVIGAILNGGKSKLQEFKVDFILFIAGNNVDKRWNVYNYIANRYMKEFGFSRKEDLTLDNGKAILMAKIDNIHEIVSKLIKFK